MPPKDNPPDPIADRFSLLELDQPPRVSGPGLPPAPTPSPPAPGSGGRFSSKEKSHVVLDPNAVHVRRVKYTVKRTTGQYENDQVEMEARILPGQDPVTVCHRLRELAERAVAEGRPKPKASSPPAPGTVRLGRRPFGLGGFDEPY